MPYFKTVIRNRVCQILKIKDILQSGVKNLEERFSAKENSFFKIIILIGIYRLLLDTLYIFMINPLFEYGPSGFFRYEISLIYFISWLVILIFSPVIAGLLSYKNPSSLLISLLNFMYFIPLTSYIGCKGAVAINFIFWSIVYWAVLLVMQYKMPVLTLKPIKVIHPQMFMWILTVSICSFVFYISWKYTGLRVSMDLLGVYELRQEFRSYDLSKISKYILALAPMILTGSMAYWITTKKWLVVSIEAAVFLLLFSIGGHKTIFFTLFLVVGSILFFKEWMINAFPVLFIGVNVIAILEKLVFNSIRIVDLFVRRMMFVPVALGESYYKFFSNNPLNLFREGVMGWLSFERIYMTTIVRTIGEFQGKYNLNANTGLIGDMFANLPPILGVIIMPIILVVCFRVFDMMLNGLGAKIVLPFAVFFANAFINSSWSTTLLTHGFLVTCFMLYFFPREEGKK